LWGIGRELNPAPIADAYGLFAWPTKLL